MPLYPHRLITKSVQLVPIALTLCLLQTQARATEAWLIASQGESVNTGQKMKLEVVKPADENWPQALTVKLSSEGVTEEVVFESAGYANDTGDKSSVRRLYTGTPTKRYVGVIRAELAQQTSNRLLLLASNEESGQVQLASGAVAATVVGGASADAEKSISDAPVVIIAKPGDEPPLSTNEPTYFLVGDSSQRGTDSRFQISFKYRPFDPKGSVAEFAPFLSNLYFSYTQTTLWDIGEDSSPFRDTSYRPGLFFRWAGTGRQVLPDEWRAGLEHESNGQGGLDSRSINTAFIRPTWNIELPDSRRLSLMPKFYQYLEKDDNPDITRYRGYADWQMRYGREDGLIVGALYRLGTGGYSTGQVDLSYPISDRIFAGTGTFLHLQLFSGYGETLLEYNQRSDTQIRIGLSVAR